MIEIKNVSKTYPNGTKGLQNVNLTIEQGEFVVIVGYQEQENQPYSDQLID